MYMGILLRFCCVPLLLALVLCDGAIAQTPLQTQVQTANAAATRLRAMAIAANVQALVQYAAQGDIAVVNLLLDAGVSASAKDPVRGVTALHNAAALGHLRIANRLMELGADVNATDWHGVTPLINAAHGGYVDMARALIAKGADVNAAPGAAPTALAAAMQGDKSAMVELLLKAGAKADVASKLESVRPPDAAGAQTFLAYADVLAAQDKALPKLTDSAFHTWDVPQKEAARIIEAWQSEPVTMPWTRIQLARHVTHKMMPTRGARGLALTHVAMNDAYLLALERHLEPKLVVSMAAAQVLGYIFNSEEAGFDRIAWAVAAQLGGVAPNQLSAAALQALDLGYRVGQRVARYGDTDGAQKGWNGVRLQYYGEGRYYGPGAWEPTGPYFYYPPDEPFAPGWRTWALESGSEFRPTPLAYGSPKYLRDLQEVVQIVKNLTPEQLKIAKFWVDGHGSVTPAGHWNQIAMEQVTKAKLDDKDTARLFALLNVAEADTFIAAWDAKYHYWTVRPVTAAKWLLNVTMVPPILTPPFPSYVSGHAAFSGAAARVLGAYFPADAKRFDEMAEEAAYSRLLGGIHFKSDNDDGLVLGRQVATKVLKKFGSMQD
jgi:hypothetical protein